MMVQKELSDDTFEVVVNLEAQYSIWPAVKEIPAGWRAVGMRGAKGDCPEHIKATWTDMRPLSLRVQMDGNAT